MPSLASLFRVPQQKEQFMPTPQLAMARESFKPFQEIGKLGQSLQKPAQAVEAKLGQMPQQIGQLLTGVKETVSGVSKKGLVQPAQAFSEAIVRPTKAGLVKLPWVSDMTRKSAKEHGAFGYGGYGLSGGYDREEAAKYAHEDATKRPLWVITPKDQFGSANWMPEGYNPIQSTRNAFDPWWANEAAERRAQKEALMMPLDIQDFYPFNAYHYRSIQDALREGKKPYAGWGILFGGITGNQKLGIAAIENSLQGNPLAWAGFLTAEVVNALVQAGIPQTLVNTAQSAINAMLAQKKPAASHEIIPYDAAAHEAKIRQYERMTTQREEQTNAWLQFIHSPLVTQVRERYDQIKNIEDDKTRSDALRDLSKQLVAAHGQDKATEILQAAVSPYSWMPKFD